MSTATDHKRREAARRWRHVHRLKDWAKEAKIILRPLYLPLLAAAGLYLAVEELKRSPLHHNTIIWVLGFGLAGAALVGGYKEVRNRIVLRGWLELEDQAELRDRLPLARKAAAQLPRWHRARFHAKKMLLEDVPAIRARSPHPTPKEPARKPERALGLRLRTSAAFISSVLVLGVVGAYSFVQWLQIVVSDFGNPTPWLVAWILVAGYFVGAMGLVWWDAKRRPQRRRESVAQDM